MSKRPALGVLVVLGAILAIMPLSGPSEAQPAQPPQAAQPAQPAEEKNNKLLLMFDSSGSMREPDASGGTKMQAAKQAFDGLIPKLPEASQVGLRVYGATVFSADDPGACQDTQNVVPVGPLDRPALSNAVQDFEPYGETPIAESLRQAAKDLGTEGKRTILLVSDGEETCDPDPCETAKEISGLGIDLKIDVVGFDVKGKVRDQLRCITDAGNGTFYETDDVEDLTASLERLAVRAFRPFRVDGTEVQGSKQKTDGPVLEAGQYVDTAPAVRQTKHYRIRRTLQNSTLHVGVTARPGPGERINQLELKTTSLEGEPCGYGLGSEVSFANTNPLVTAATSSWSNVSAEVEGCASAPEVLLSIRQGDRSGSNEDELKDVPVELVVIEEPPVDDPSVLDEQTETRANWRSMPTEGSGTPLTTGASFSDAPEVRPGHFSTSLFPGEVQFVKVHLDWGEHLQTEVRALKPDAELAEQIDYPQVLDLRLIAPTRGDAHATLVDAAIRDQTFLERAEDAEAQATTLGIQYANRAGIDRSQYNTSIAGTYYVAISLGRDEDGESYTVPMDVLIDVQGTKGVGAPVYVGEQTLVGPGVDKVPGARPGEALPPKTADEDSGSGETGDGLTGQAAGEESGLTPVRLTIVLVLSGVLLVLVGVVAIRHVVRRRRENAAAAHRSH